MGKYAPLEKLEGWDDSVAPRLKEKAGMSLVKSHGGPVMGTIKGDGGRMRFRPGVGQRQEAERRARAMGMDASRWMALVLANVVERGIELELVPIR